MRKIILWFFALLLASLLEVFPVNASYRDFQYVSLTNPIVSIFYPGAEWVNWCNNVSHLWWVDSIDCVDQYLVTSPYPRMYFGVQTDWEFSISRDYNPFWLDQFELIKWTNNWYSPTLLDRNFSGTAYQSSQPYLSRSSYRLFFPNTFSNNSALKWKVIGVAEFSTWVTYYWNTNTTIISNLDTTLWDWYSVWYSPGYSFSTFDCDSDLDGAWQCNTNFDIKYYEISSNIFDDWSYNIYTWVFVTYISNSITSNFTWLYNNWITNNFDTFVWVQSGTDMYFSVYDCYSPSLAYIRDYCSVKEYWYLPYSAFAHIPFTYTNNPINSNIWQSVWMFFAWIDYASFYLTTNLYIWDSSSSVYTKIDDTTSTISWLTFDETPNYSLTWWLTSWTIFPTWDISSWNSVPIISWFNSNIFSWFSVSWNNLFYCSDEFLSWSFSLYFSDIPVINQLYQVTDYIAWFLGWSGVSVPDTNILSPFSCAYWAYLYWKTNIVSTPQLPIFSWSNLFSLQQDQKNTFYIFFNFLLSIPVIFLLFKMFK